MNQLAINDFNNFLVGFDRLQDMFIHGNSRSAYPPYNLIKVKENEYKIEIALAGWNKNDIEVVHTKTDAILTITGKKQTSDKDSYYLHRGISGKSFAHNFALAEHVAVEDADFTDGLLTVSLGIKIPKEQQPQQIKIT